MEKKEVRSTEEKGALVTFDGLRKHVATMTPERSPVVVAISGFAGSGKSTLATRLARVFGASDRQVLRVDHFYAAEPRGPGLFDDYDWPLLEHVLADLRHGGRLRYRGRGFDDTNLVVDEPAPEIAIVEGIQLLRRERMDLFDVTVWIECPREVALERARARDRLQGHDEEYMKLWDNLWGPRNQEYFESHHPEKLAAFRYLTHDSPVDL